MQTRLLCVLSSLVALVFTAPFDERELDWNLNTNQQTLDPLKYSGEWGEGHVYTPSPDNWRFPFYTLFLDRFVNGDPANDDINGTVFEHDVTSNQLRYGGDLAGLLDSLDYLQGMGIKGLYVAGTPFLNLPYKYDQYSPIDFTILDHHLGTIREWQAAMNQIHSRGMYVLLDITGATMSDLLGFDGFPNATAPFKQYGYDVFWKSNITYLDFSFKNEYKEECEYPRFWNESGQRVLATVDQNFSKLVGCFDSEFDQYGDTEAFGNFPDWQRQLSKFASVQDRLREWEPPVRQKIEHMACLLISQLDIDGVRFDKATQMTVDAEAEIAASLRTCARKYGKKNFFLPGEITGGNDFGSIYLGRGREALNRTDNITEAVLFTSSDNDQFIRNDTLQALDAAAFHYSIYRTLTRFLGMDGNLSAGYDVPSDFVDIWNVMLTSNDFLNANTEVFDPRHMHGTSNQDVFRWPSIKNGTDRMLLALFITTLHMPGIPLLLWGEEQAFYVLDSTAANYLFGRQPMSSNTAWQAHGCYTLDSEQYYDWPADSVLHGCKDDSVSLDHRDPTHPVRNIIRSMHSLREQYPVLNDGFKLLRLSNKTHQVFPPGSYGVATETGIWSVVRTQLDEVQQLDSGNQSVWLVYQNEDHQVSYDFDCSGNETALFAPFPGGTIVKNLISPYEEIELLDGPGKRFFIDKSQEANGCLDKLMLDHWGFKAFVPKTAWISLPPMLTGFSPGYDARLPSAPAVDIELHFSLEMDCDLVTKNLVVNSTTQDNMAPKIDPSSIDCGNISEADSPSTGPYVPSRWRWTATLTDVADGIHVVTLNMSSAAVTDTQNGTGSVDHLMFRIGQEDNPLVFQQGPHSAAYTYSRDPATKDLKVNHTAPGADKWRYSTNWGSSWSAWEQYQGGVTTIAELPWSGTRRQRWSGDHVFLQYWSKMAGSSDHVIHADADSSEKIPRRFPHLHAQGLFNLFGYDSGLPNDFTLDPKTGISTFHLSTEWPTEMQINVWGIGPDGHPDQTFVYGDSDNDSVLDRALPGSLSPTMLNLSVLPPYPHVAYRIELDEAKMRWQLVSEGSRLLQILVFSLLWVLPVLTAVLAIWVYMGAFYKIKFNKIGNPMSSKAGFFAMLKPKRGGFQRLNDDDRHSSHLELGVIKSRHSTQGAPDSAVVAPKKVRRCILIATMEYDIEDWGIKIKIGGLGVMAQLMGKALEGHDLVWVVPCVGGVNYPVDQPANPMLVTVMDQQYEVNVQYHKLRNITYVLLDAPIFRQQSKTEPYPPRMDDLDSAIYYSAWNACIARAAERFPIDIYHINDYHGAAAPLYLLPKTIPCCLSLHNAEFQGLWPMRTKKEQEEICKAFNLSHDIVERYIQFGGVFNLLHAGASYLRVHQGGFGAVGVSNKYGSRSYARYPIFWALKHIGKLPNPDPSDTEPWDEAAEAKQVITVDPAFEAARGDLRKQAQEWANLTVDPSANLFVFVGRWSVQKGVDLIADVFPSVLEKHPDVQLICIGPVIDLYGKFAALKLEAIMKKYPGRVYSKPEFTQLPPYIFSGAEFALIPSRDEPFGLVAVEFGRKGALGVGARVGGLGQMPGWWFTVESTTSKHLIQQFKSAINDALASSIEVRADMRARSAKQRFPVARWVEDLEALHGASIRLHQAGTTSGKASARRSDPTSGLLGPFVVGGAANENANPYGLSSFELEAQGLRDSSHERAAQAASGLGRALSLGKRVGPGHRRPADSNDHLTRVAEAGDDAELEISSEDAEAACRIENVQEALSSLEGRQPGLALRPPTAGLSIGGDHGPRGRAETQSPKFSISAPGTNEALPISPTVGMQSNKRSRYPSSMAGAPTSLLPRDALQTSRRQRSTSLLSLHEVTSGRLDYSLQKVDLDFTDSQGEYYRKFEDLLQQKFTAKSSENTLVIEDFLQTSEKEWGARYRAEKLGGPRSTSATVSDRRHSSPCASSDTRRASSSHRDSAPSISSAYSGSALSDEFLLGENYVRPRILTRWLQIRIFDWPIYCILLALGQIMAANSYQIVLLTGGSGADQTEKLYIIGGIYIVASCLWWAMYRKMSPRFVTSIPFAIYGLGFILVGLAPFIGNIGGRQWARNVATGMYAIASASGSLFFALNFGDEGGAPIQQWVYRASIVQGIQQIYIAALFYWGQVLSETMSSPNHNDRKTIADKPILAAIACPIGVLFLAIGTLLFTSLPSYYRQTPGKIPYFYKSLLRRKLIVWMLISVVLQNYFLSTLYGRSWGYLWSSKYAPPWAIAVLAIIFFVGIWVAMLLVFAQLSKSHSWILPMFAFGLLAPRWAQMWWGTSSYGLWLPWMPGGPVGGAIAGRSLWLWLGVLDSMQGVGIGMALLQTLTRIHVAVVLTASQILGAAVTLIAKGSAPNRDGPGSVFPDLAAGVVAGLMQPWFWVALACQLAIPVGFFFFFRKEQMSKP